MRQPTNLLRRQVPPEPSQGPSETLSALLDRLELLTGVPGTQAERDQVAERIMDLFAIYPTEAPGWQRAWKALRPAQEENR